MGRHPSALAPQQRLCQAEYCGKAVGGLAFFCDRHWRMLPENLRYELFDAYELGQEEDIDKVTMAFLDVSMRCITHVKAVERGYGKR